MKASSYIFLAAILMCCGRSFAQAPIVTSTIANAAGDTLFFQPCVADNFNPGPSGAGVMWDFSHVSLNGGLKQQYYVAASSNMDGDSFPTANLSILSPTGIPGVNSIDDYLQVSTSGIQVRGYEVPEITYYYDAEDFLRLPITYNDNWVDSFHATISPDGSPQYYRRGTISVRADGYGTLKLPTGNVTNVLRVKFTEDYIDDLSSMGAGTIHYTSLLYNWYKPGVKGAVMACDSAWYTNSSPRKLLSYQPGVSTTTGIISTAANASINIYPNPADHITTIVAPVSSYEYTFTNLSGQMVVHGIANENSTRVNVSGCAKGIYLVTIRQEDGYIHMQKLVIN